MPYITEYAFRPVRPSPGRRALNWFLILLMLTGIVAITLPFWPGFTYTLHSSWPGHQAVVARAQTEAQASQPPGPGNWLLIPSIGVKTPIVEGADLGVLDRQDGVWHQTGDVAKGNFVIAGHRFKYLPPNQTTLYLLDRLKTGERIVVWYGGHRYAYAAAEQKTVGRDATQILNPTTNPQLTLYTCTDLAATKRLVVIAYPT